MTCITHGSHPVAVPRGAVVLAGWLLFAACASANEGEDTRDAAPPVDPGEGGDGGVVTGADATASGSDAGAGGTGTEASNPFGVELEPTSPLGGSTPLSDVPCLTAGDRAADEWALHLGSRDYLLQQGYSAAYVNAHFCPIEITYEAHPASGTIRGYGYARVTYRVTFAPYLSWWQHHFPVVIDETSRPRLTDGAARVDESGEAALVPELDYLPAISSVMSPEQVGRALEALIGPFTAPIAIEMGPNVGRRTVRLYARTENDNSGSAGCSDRVRVGTIDVETGEGEISYTGACSGG